MICSLSVFGCATALPAANTIPMKAGRKACAMRVIVLFPRQDFEPTIHRMEWLTFYA
jgi:hypothetical protein